MDIAETRKYRLNKWFSNKTLPEHDVGRLTALLEGKANLDSDTARQIERFYLMPEKYLDQPTAKHSELTSLARPQAPKKAMPKRSSKAIPPLAIKNCGSVEGISPYIPVVDNRGTVAVPTLLGEGKYAFPVEAFKSARHSCFSSWEVDNNAMELAGISKRYIVLIDERQRNPRGEIYVFLYANQIRMRRRILAPNGYRILAESTENTWPPDEEVMFYQIDIIGRVIYMYGAPE